MAKAKGKRPIGKGVDQNGRSKREQFCIIDYSFMRSEAFKHLSGNALKVYMAIRARYSGFNNGEISFSAREGKKAVNLSKDTTNRALNELVEKGFLKVSQKGSFDHKIGRATTWIVTDLPLDEDALPTKEFTRWKASQK